MRYFDRSDFDCKETGENRMDEDFLLELDCLRHACGFPFVVVSGFRSVTHSAERKKLKPGYHPEGIASDIRVSAGLQRGTLIKLAIARGFTGIGIAKTFIHVDRRPGELVVWPY